jgi:hypothetical protein
MMANSKLLLELSFKRRMSRSNSSSSLSTPRNRDTMEVRAGKAAGEEVAAAAKEEIIMIKDIRVTVIRDKTGPQEEATQRITTKEITKTIAKKITVNKSMLTKVTKQANISLNSKIKYRMNLGKRATDLRQQVEQDKVEKEDTKDKILPRRPMKSARVVKVANTNQRSMEPFWDRKQEQTPRKGLQHLLNRIRERSSRRTDLRSLRSEEFQ